MYLSGRFFYPVEDGFSLTGEQFLKPIISPGDLIVLRNYSATKALRYCRKSP
jgi:hypothetical protein